MKVSNDFVLREIAGEFMLVPVGKAAADFSGLIVLNETGSTIFKALSTERTKKELVDAVLSEYDVDRETADADVEDFLQQLRQIHALIEDGQEAAL